VAEGYEDWTKDMEIKKLDRKIYEGRKFTVCYLTNGYYDIVFYRKNGFDIIGFDLYAYTNTDPERHEVRIEMGKQL